MVTRSKVRQQRGHVAATRRNASVLGATVVAVGALMLYPTSTDRLTAARRTAPTAAPPGIVAAPAPDPTSQAAEPTQAPTPAPSEPSGPPPAVAAPPVAAPRSTSAAPPPRPAGVTVVNGTSAQTAYGPVQVQIRVQAGRILSATAIDYPQGSGRDREINGYAIPALQDETVAAQSDQIDTVSGATFTSDGYVRSLQAALDAAHLR